MKDTMPLKAAYEFGAAHGLGQEVDDIRDMVIEWDLSGTSSLRRAYIILLFEEHGVFDAFKRECWPFGNTPGGARKRAAYLRFKSRYDSFLAGRGPETENDTDDEDVTEAETGLEFALEAHLRDFLAQNLERVESELRLYSSPESTGVEFPIDGGRIDLLAVDREGRFVVIELKLSRGRNKTLGQISYYMAWIDQHLGRGPCRGIIIASEITEELKIAVARVPGVSLARYHMSFSIERVAG